MFELILLVPLLALPIVCLFAFAGCEGDDPVLTPSSTPDAAPVPPATPATPPATPATPPPTPPAAPTPPTYKDIVLATPGIAAFWRLNDAGGNIAKDCGPLSPKTDGRYIQLPTGVGVKQGQTGALTAKDPGDRATEFDGANGCVEVLYDARLNPAPNVSFSVEAWIKREIGPTIHARHTIISSREIDAGVERGFDLAMLIDAGGIASFRGQVYPGAAGVDSAINVTPTSGDPAAWRQVVFTYDGTTNTLNLSVNVVNVPAPFAAPPFAGATYEQNKAGKFRIAAGHDPTGAPVDYFAGLIDEVAFYSSVLSAADANAHFHAAV